ncbi:hypothetical protein V8E53_005762 [Lactarius tabidus]
MIHRTHSCIYIRLPITIHGMPDLTIKARSSVTITSDEDILPTRYRCFWYQKLAEDSYRPQRYTDAMQFPSDTLFSQACQVWSSNKTRIPHDHPDCPRPPRSQVPPVRGGPGDDKLGGHDGLISAYRTGQIVHASELSVLSFAFSSRCSSQEQLQPRYSLPSFISFDWKPLPDTNDDDALRAGADCEAAAKMCLNGSTSE